MKLCFGAALALACCGLLILKFGSILRAEPDPYGEYSISSFFNSTDGGLITHDAASVLLDPSHSWFYAEFQSVSIPTRTSPSGSR
jgi:hypothetical protein